MPSDVEDCENVNVILHVEYRIYLVKTMFNCPEGVVGNFVARQRELYHIIVVLQALEDRFAAARPKIIPSEVDALQRFVFSKHFAQR